MLKHTTALFLVAACTTAFGQNATIDKAAAENGAVKTSSGLVYRSLKEGTGPQPKDTDAVRVHYRGTLPDGKEFDSSLKRNEPAEGVQRMKVGGKARLTCPPELAYGERGAGGGAIPPNATLQFEVELLAIR